MKYLLLINISCWYYVSAEVFYCSQTPVIVWEARMCSWGQYTSSLSSESGDFLFLVNVGIHLGHLQLQRDGRSLKMLVGKHGGSFSLQVCVEVEGYQPLPFDMTALHCTGSVSACGSLSSVICKDLWWESEVNPVLWPVSWADPRWLLLMWIA